MKCLYFKDKECVANCDVQLTEGVPNVDPDYYDRDKNWYGASPNYGLSKKCENRLLKND